MSTPVNVFLSGDIGAMEGAYITMASLLSSNTQNQIKFHWLTDATSLALLSILEKDLKQFSENFTFEVHELPVAKVEQFDINNEHIKAFAYARLFFGEYFDLTGPAIYLDTDTFVNLDLSVIHNMDFSKYEVHACTDYGFKKEVAGPFLQEVNLFKSLGLNFSDTYFNSGILIFDFSFYKSTVTMDRIQKFIANSKGQFSFEDQSILNFLFHGHWKEADGKWNSRIYMKREGPVELQMNDRITHTYGPHKPWQFEFKPDLGINKYFIEISKKANPAISEHFKPRETIQLNTGVVMSYRARNLRNKAKGLLNKFR